MEEFIFIQESAEFETIFTGLAEVYCPEHENDVSVQFLGNTF